MPEQPQNLIIKLRRIANIHRPRLKIDRSRPICNLQSGRSTSTTHVDRQSAFFVRDFRYADAVGPWRWAAAVSLQGGLAVIEFVVGAVDVEDGGAVGIEYPFLVAIAVSVEGEVPALNEAEGVV